MYLKLLKCECQTEPLPPGDIDWQIDDNGVIHIKWTAGDKCSDDFEVSF